MAISYIRAYGKTEDEAREALHRKLEELLRTDPRWQIERIFVGQLPAEQRPHIQQAYVGSARLIS